MSKVSAQVLRVGVIGAGYFSQFHLYGWKNIPGIDLVAIADADLPKARQMASAYGASHAMDSVDAMIEEHAFDLIDIVTPPSSHAPLIKKVLAKKIAIICQKPFSHSYAQAIELTDAAKQAGVPLIIHENFRFMPWFRETRRLIEQGLLGRLHSISFRLRTGDGQGPQAYLDRQPYFQKMPRFLVMETAIHLIDTFRYLCGEISAVYAHLRRINPIISGEDAGFIHMEFESGLTGSFDGNRLNDHIAENPRRTFGEMWLEGEAGVLRLDGNGHLHFKTHQGSEKPLAYDSGSNGQFGGGACEALQRHVLGHLMHGDPVENSATAYLQNIKIQEAVYASHISGNRIAIRDFTPPTTPINPFPQSTSH